VNKISNICTINPSSYTKNHTSTNANIQTPVQPCLPVAEIAFEAGFDSLEGVPWAFQKAVWFPLSQYSCQKPPDTRSLILVLTTAMHLIKPNLMQEQVGNQKDSLNDNPTNMSVMEPRKF
jgi:AraC-like DNA-binding protein